MKKAFHFAILGLLMSVTSAAAQTTTPPPSPSASPGPGSYDSLSVGNQKIALALFKAQVQPTLTLDEIAGLKQNSTGWRQVFKQMKAQRLVTEKNLGQVVSRFKNSLHSTGAVVSAANRSKGNAGDSGVSGDDKGLALHGNGGSSATSAGNSASSGRGNAYGQSGPSGNSGRGNGHVK
jgi:hypothetical protein